jgi:serine/threonine protein kinase
MSAEDDRTRVIGKAASGTPASGSGGSASGSGAAAELGDFGIFGAAAARTPLSPVAGTASTSNNLLPVNTRLGEFEIIGLIGEGGFGIVYLALDHSLERQVALKEYMPSALATRGQGLNVSVKSSRHAETFEAGLRSFVNEAKLLAHFDHEALVKVHRFWEANGTAYMVMPLYEGVTLKQALKDLPERPSEEWLKGMLAPLLDALELMHAKQCFHRDIAPDNVLILHDGRPVLLDFGAARRVIGDMTQALTVILKPGFAPVEQYAEVPEMKQGPWTDVYALAALIYYAIGGRAPTPSVARMMNDTLTPALELGRGRYSPEFLQAVDCALVVHPDRRTPSMTELRAELGIAAPERGRTVLEVRGPSSVFANADSTSELGDAIAAQSRPYQPSQQEARQPAGVQLPRLDQTAKVAQDQVIATTRRPAYGWLMIPGLLLVLGLAGGIGWYLFNSASQSTKAAGAKPKPVATSTQTTSGTSGNNPVAETNPSGTGTSPSAPPTFPPSPSPSPSPSPESTKQVFSPAVVNDLLYQARSPDWPLTGQASPQTVEIDKDFIRLAIRSERAGFLYIFMLGSDTRDWWLIFPNGKDRNNKLIAGEAMSLPRKSWPIQSGGPPGTTRFLAIASEAERDFNAAGLKLTRDFGKFDLTAAALAYEQSDDPAALFAGVLRCPNGQSACNKAYGAAQFQIEEVARRLIPKKPLTNPSD